MGNSNGRRNTVSRIPNNHPTPFMRPHATTHHASRPCTTAYVRISPLKADATVTNADQTNRRPIVFRRSRLTISAPTTPNMEKAIT